MKMSCNGCRVLRKGCSRDCVLRSSLRWIDSYDSQANATLFLAKFYGRAGLINLISAAPAHLRPVVFLSLLYEACGRIVNPVDGSVGLMASGNWSRCQAAVEAVLKGEPLVVQVRGDDDGLSTAASAPHTIGIRHISKDASSGAAASLHRVVKTRHRCKRPSKSSIGMSAAGRLELAEASEEKFTITGWGPGGDHGDFSDELKWAASHDSFSVATVEGDSEIHRGRTDPAEVKPAASDFKNAETDLRLELTLGLN